jgi:phosphate starvation-inducible membrane PsiE
MSQRVSGEPVPLSWTLSSLVTLIKFLEDAIHAVVAVLLATLGVGLIIYTLRHIIADVVIVVGPHSLPGIAPGAKPDVKPDVLNEILSLFNEILLLFIVAELLNAVAIAIEHGGALNPEPFILVGLVAGIRRVLILTAQAEHDFRWNPQGIELVILIALILVMAITTLVWRRSKRAGDGAH